jgi:large subunit ribosomal protein L18
MKKHVKKIYLQQKKRYLKKIKGTPEKPRLSVFRSHQHIYAQLIDDKNGKTIAFSSTLDPQVMPLIQKAATQQAAYVVGESVGKKALGKEVQKVTFDRGNKPYHGRIKSLAEGARNAGLVF